MKIWIALMLLSLVSLSAGAQSLATAAAEAAKTPHAWPSPDPARELHAPASVSPDLPVPATPGTSTADAVFVCKARSVKALFTVVNAEHHGYFTQTFAGQKLRDNPALATAAKTDAAGCEAGTYPGAMEKALKAEAVEQARLQALLK